MKILAVDDDPIILELLDQFVCMIGEHELTTALSGPEALQLLEASEAEVFDCFLFDIQMPQMDGIDLTKNVRSLPSYTDTPILMLTAMSDKRYVDAAFSAGATDYITKPFEVPELRARLGLVEGLVQARQERTRKIFATQNISSPSEPDAPDNALELHEPISIYDVDNVIEYMAMQNYVAQLSRGALFGSTTFAFTIRKIDEHHQSMTPFEFYSLISDVAEIISDTLAGHQFLMAYAGSGTFVCVTESGWRPKMSALMDAVNLSLSRTELYDNSARKLYVRVSAGEAIRLIWKSADSVMEAVAAAHTSAEAASEAHERSMSDLWSVEQRA
ncbi:response regulator [Sulfitobacter sp. M57]|uniref:response regulator n=1 Tax=unclassified Sulfitobacter TaxID=196795 RepID=UPI0023E1E055|nr:MULTISPECIES: response regulator [unclassified Sulfitobacter]MDF3416066.1 response regulator [Sulfitobacter sp. KE5]MDF3423545.1 response regulator [Sulfitobacter sp. KE43]MDF3434653.1 response regulator [Sulfitobacter sp. KE42]MDF3460251.1 response regulator [Sulfitobacter sp. S74]MDF3464191.1 response regulator [Sulfitobacter sp. Ks18]